MHLGDLPLDVEIGEGPLEHARELQELRLVHRFAGGLVAVQELDAGKLRVGHGGGTELEPGLGTAGGSGRPARGSGAGAGRSRSGPGRRRRERNAQRLPARVPSLARHDAGTRRRARLRLLLRGVPRVRDLFLLDGRRLPSARGLRAGGRGRGIKPSFLVPLLAERDPEETEHRLDRLPQGLRGADLERDHADDDHGGAQRQLPSDLAEEPRRGHRDEFARLARERAIARGDEIEEPEKEEEAEGAERRADSRLERGLEAQTVPSPGHQRERHRPGADDPEEGDEPARDDRSQHASLVPDRAGPEKLDDVIARVAGGKGQPQERADREETKSQDLELPADRDPAQRPHDPAQVPCCQEAR